MKDSVTRRDFLKTSTLATVGFSAGLISTGNYAYGFSSETLKVGLIGCGGRGTGAAQNCVESANGIEIHAMGDLFEDRLDSSRKHLKENLGDAYKVKEENAFIGWDAYKNVIASDVDIIILATPPAFRPIHIEAVVEAGKHLFTEKPVGVDPVGIRKVIAAARKAQEKGLSIVAGTQRRHDPKYNEAMRRIHQGEIGEIMAGQVYWNQGGLWKYDRKPGMSDVEWQLRNWLYFTWLSGDHMVEQHIHNIDVANWALQGHPIKANGVGGRQVRVDPAYGHIFDHFAVELEYESGARILSMCRQQDGTSRYVGEFFMGTNGTSDGQTYVKGNQNWRWKTPDGEEAVNPYVQEHTDLITSIRGNHAFNEAEQVAESTLSAIMAREAAYTGLVITWDEIYNANLSLMPDNLSFGDIPIPPIPQPGVTKLERPPFGHFHQS